MIVRFPIWVIYSRGWSKPHGFYLTYEDAAEWVRWSKRDDLLIVKKTGALDIYPDHPGSAVRRIFGDC